MQKRHCFLNRSFSKQIILFVKNTFFESFLFVLNGLKKSGATELLTPGQPRKRLTNTRRCFIFFFKFRILYHVAKNKDKCLVKKKKLSPSLYVSTFCL